MDLDMQDVPTEAKLESPASCIDIDRANAGVDMMLPMRDPCPQCGGFKMMSGDWICWGVCYHCYDAALKEQENGYIA